VAWVPFPSHIPLRELKIPEIISVHDLIPCIFRSEFPRTYILWRLVVLPALQRCSAIIAVSESTKKDLLSFTSIPESKVHVVHNGFQEHLLHLDDQGSPRSRPYLLYVASTLYPYKNTSALLSAFNKARLQRDFELIIAGKSVPRYQKELHACIERNGLAAAVTTVSNISDASLAALYRHAALFVYPSLYEGFGMPPLEAMAFGIPVVASRAASIPEVCGDAAYYVDERSDASLAEGMLAVLTSDSLRKRLTEAGFRRAGQFSWDQLGRQLFDMCLAVE
jgi:glycosyltransferase involved in cell wall biosynthesis